MSILKNTNIETLVIPQQSAMASIIEMARNYCQKIKENRIKAKALQKELDELFHKAINS